MSAKTPLHVTPSRHAFSAYLYRCLASSFPEEPARATWQEKPPAPEHKLGETKA
ncbi:MAG: hypothetical protein ACK5QX_12290 [bacterium]|jgi:hypothetical protein